MDRLYSPDQFKKIYICENKVDRGQFPGIITRMQNGIIVDGQPEVVSLYWEDSYAIALELIRKFPAVDLDRISLGMIYQWTIDLPGFGDDKQLVNDEILKSIYQDWYEEVNPI
jgi:FeS assembly protein IscX